MAFEALLEQFKFELNLVQQEHLDVIESSNKVIALCTNVLTVFRKEIVKNDFNNIDAEICFFKYVKQIPLIPLIYNTEVRSFELQFPKGNSKCQEKHIENKINKINQFFLYNTDFSQYVSSDRLHFDLQYYTREFLMPYHISYSMSYFQDPEFSSARDLLLGKLKAYEQFIIYLQNRMNSDPTQFIEPDYRLQWTASKSDLTELVYALYYSQAVNNGNLEIKVLARALAKIFQCDIGDVYKTFSGLKSRTKSPTKFLDKLNMDLRRNMDKSDE